MFPRPLAILLALLLAIPLAARAADSCAPVLKAELALTIVQHRPLVALTVDGAQATLLLDTGAERTLLTEAAAQRLGLTAHYTYAGSVSGIGGLVRTGEVRPDRVALGGVAMPGFFISVAALTFPAEAGRAVDGLLGADMLDEYDVELDFAHGRVRLYAPAACATPLLPWPAGYGRVEAHQSMHRHLFFQATLDGYGLAAFIDTGAMLTTLDTQAALRAGASAAALARDPAISVRGVSGAAAAARMHRFARLDLPGGGAGTAWTDPPLVVTPLRLDDADLILGADFLATHRVWLSYGSRQVFVVVN